MKEYTTIIEVKVVLSISDGQLNRERQFQKGKQDRKKGLCCMSNHGAYLEGWYNPDKNYYYITKDAAHLL